MQRRKNIPSTEEALNFLGLAGPGRVLPSFQVSLSPLTRLMRELYRQIENNRHSVAANENPFNPCFEIQEKPALLTLPGALYFFDRVFGIDLSELADIHLLSEEEKGELENTLNEEAQEWFDEILEMLLEKRLKETPKEASPLLWMLLHVAVKRPSIALKPEFKKPVMRFWLQHSGLLIGGAQAEDRAQTCQDFSDLFVRERDAQALKVLREELREYIPGASLTEALQMRQQFPEYMDLDCIKQKIEKWVDEKISRGFHLVDSRRKLTYHELGSSKISRPSTLPGLFSAIDEVFGISPSELADIHLLSEEEKGELENTLNVKAQEWFDETLEMLLEKGLKKRPKEAGPLLWMLLHVAAKRPSIALKPELKKPVIRFWLEHSGLLIDGARAEDRAEDRARIFQDFSDLFMREQDAQALKVVSEELREYIPGASLLEALQMRQQFPEYVDLDCIKQKLEKWVDEKISRGFHLVDPRRKLTYYKYELGSSKSSASSTLLGLFSAIDEVFGISPFEEKMMSFLSEEERAKLKNALREKIQGPLEDRLEKNLKRDRDSATVSTWKLLHIAAKHSSVTLNPEVEKSVRALLMLNSNLWMDTQSENPESFIQEKRQVFQDFFDVFTRRRKSSVLEALKKEFDQFLSTESPIEAQAVKQMRKNFYKCWMGDKIESGLHALDESESFFSSNFEFQKKLTLSDFSQSLKDFYRVFGISYSEEDVMTFVHREEGEELKAYRQEKVQAWFDQTVERALERYVKTKEQEVCIFLWMLLHVAAEYEYSFITLKPVSRDSIIQLWMRNSHLWMNTTQVEGDELCCNFFHVVTRGEGEKQALKVLHTNFFSPDFNLTHLTFSALPQALEFFDQVFAVEFFEKNIVDSFNRSKKRWLQEHLQEKIQAWFDQTVEMTLEKGRLQAKEEEACTLLWMLLHVAATKHAFITLKPSSRDDVIRVWVRHSRLWIDTAQSEGANRKQVRQDFFNVITRGKKGTQALEVLQKAFDEYIASVPPEVALKMEQQLPQCWLGAQLEKKRRTIATETNFFDPEFKFQNSLTLLDLRAALSLFNQMFSIDFSKEKVVQSLSDGEKKELEEFLRVKIQAWFDEAVETVAETEEKKASGLLWMLLHVAAKHPFINLNPTSIGSVMRVWWDNVDSWIDESQNNYPHGVDKAHVTREGRIQVCRDLFEVVKRGEKGALKDLQCLFSTYVSNKPLQKVLQMKLGLSQLVLEFNNILPRLKEKAHSLEPQKEKKSFAKWIKGRTGTDKKLTPFTDPTVSSHLKKCDDWPRASLLEKCQQRLPHPLRIKKCFLQASRLESKELKEVFDESFKQWFFTQLNQSGLKNLKALANYCLVIPGIDLDLVEALLSHLKDYKGKRGEVPRLEEIRLDLDNLRKNLGKRSQEEEYKSLVERCDQASQAIFAEMMRLWDKEGKPIKDLPPEISSCRPPIKLISVGSIKKVFLCQEEEKLGGKLYVLKYVQGSMERYEPIVRIGTTIWSNFLREKERVESKEVKEVLKGLMPTNIYNAKVSIIKKPKFFITEPFHSRGSINELIWNIHLLLTVYQT